MNEQYISELLEAWHTNNRINLYLIKHISEEGMKSTLSSRGGRNVVRQFAHIHNVRIYHLEGRAKDLAKGLTKFASKAEPSKKELEKHLNLSAERIAQFFTEAYKGKPKRRIFKKGLIPYLSYFIHHEAHHRGSILLTIKQSGHKLDNDIACKIWDYDRM